MSTLAAAAAEARHRLVEGLRQRGWDVDDEERCWGEVVKPGGIPVAIRIELSSALPFAPPTVTPWDGSGTYSWHQNHDGSLCLYSAADSGDLPWLDAAALIARIEEWFVEDEAGWPNDPPDLDLERYFEPAEGFVVYDSLERLIGRPLRLAWHGERLEVELGGKPRKGAADVMLAWAGNLGELENPVRDWDGVAAALGAGHARDIEERARRGDLHALLLRYERRGHDGAVALRVTAGRNRSKPPTLRAMEMARGDTATLRLRSGPHAEVLSNASVVVVGVGAIGSVVADLLARSGVGRIGLIDGERLRPGNSVRHLAGARYWGWNKAKAVADMLRSAEHPTAVVHRAERLTVATDAEALMTEYDLLIDATANPWTQELIAHTAEHTRRPALSVYLHRDGGVTRIDRWPTSAGETPADAVPALPGRRTELREGGCGDPVSPSPPWAAVAAATRAVGLAVLMLSGVSVPVTVLDVLEPQPDPPFDELQAPR